MLLRTLDSAVVTVLLGAALTAMLTLLLHLAG